MSAIEPTRATPGLSVTNRRLWDASVETRLERYAELLLRRNKAMNLTGARDRAAVDEHIADALSVAHLVRSPLVDVGSGGGLPGIPLALATGARVTLIEASAKKAAFLRDALAELAIEGAVIADRAEIAAHDPALRETFASATARAVGSVSTVLEVTLPFLAIGGVAILQRGRLEEAERRAAVDASLMLGGELVAEERLEGERRLLLVAKRTATPPHFPRRPGVPHRRPLCLAPAARGRRPLA